MDDGCADEPYDDRDWAPIDVDGEPVKDPGPAEPDAIAAVWPVARGAAAAAHELEAGYWFG